VDIKNLDDYVTSNESQEENADIDAPIVFVGYGINAPEYGWDDYKGVDLKGKVALLFVNEPISDHPNFFKGKAADVLRTMALQIRRDGPARGVGHTDHPPDGLGKLRLGRGPELLGHEKSYLKLDGSPNCERLRGFT